jgi:predicted PurR-regulated permease PerM
LAILVGGLVFGPLGVLFAAPVAAVVAVLWRRRRRASV